MQEPICWLLSLAYLTRSVATAALAGGCGKLRCYQKDQLWFILFNLLPALACSCCGLLDYISSLVAGKVQLRYGVALSHAEGWSNYYGHSRNAQKMEGTLQARVGAHYPGQSRHTWVSKVWP